MIYKDVAPTALLKTDVRPSKRQQIEGAKEYASKHWPCPDLVDS
jgi:hypothetical protein